MSFDMSVADFIDDPAMLGRWFHGPSWENWKVVIKGAFAENLTEREGLIFRDLAQRDPPKRRVREAWFAIGRRAGKDSVASAVATYAAALGDFARHLRPGERAVILCLAVDRIQARIVFSYIRGYFEQVPLLRPLVRSVTDSTIELRNGVDIVVATNNFRSIRGRTIAIAILDECSYWRDEQYKNPDSEVYAALRPGLATLRRSGSMIIGISTVYRRAGLLFDKWRQHHGEDGDILVIRAPSIAFNPLLDTEEIEADLKLDPERAAAEWLSEWRADLADFVDRSVVEAAIVPGCFELPFNPKYRYSAFCDPSGGSSDSFTLAVGHNESGKGILDCIREIRAPFAPESVVEEFVNILKSYHCHRVKGDRYAGEWPREQFAKRGITYEPSERSKSDIYRELLPLLNSRRVELLDNPRLISQLCSLERRTGRGTGRDSIDHPLGSHDDIANAAAGVLIDVAGGTDRSAVIRRYLLGDAA
jgi:hypothetical protein